MGFASKHKPTRWPRENPTTKLTHKPIISPCPCFWHRKLHCDVWTCCWQCYSKKINKIDSLLSSSKWQAL
jgi:hypothetical protein